MSKAQEDLWDLQKHYGYKKEKRLISKQIIIFAQHRSLFTSEMIPVHAVIIILIILLTIFLYQS
jgi:hypothetical protein